MLCNSKMFMFSATKSISELMRSTLRSRPKQNPRKLSKIVVYIYINTMKTTFYFDFYQAFKQQRHKTCKLREVVN